MSHPLLDCTGPERTVAWFSDIDGGRRAEGLVTARALVAPMVGHDYPMWLHLASSFAFVGSSSAGAPAVPAERAVPSAGWLGRAEDGGPGPVYSITKAALDRTIAAVTLVMLFPVLVAVAIAVKVSSPGPVLFRQQRIGKGGRLIGVCKFRTMVVDAEDRLRRDGLWERYVEEGYKLPAREDHRITSIGRFLRRASLDELPQLLNVVIGDMSLVGPRPIVPEELACYGSHAHCYLGVTPGLTGLWQVSGRSSIGFPERAEIDARYHAERSLGLDLRILVRTPLVVARCAGAY